MISDYLTKQERFSCIKAGALAHAGAMDSTLGPLEKSAGGKILSGLRDSADAMKSLWLLTTLGAGIPLGVFGHIMGRRISGKQLREEELKEKIRMYQMAADDMAGGLSQGAL